MPVHHAFTLLATSNLPERLVVQVFKRSQIGLKLSGNIHYIHHD